jgi:NAD(P)H-dependent flavin oxidoreductase YrpB (nitropropane dioxygenase family)
VPSSAPPPASESAPSAPRPSREDLRAQIPQESWDWLREQMRVNNIPEPKGTPASGGDDVNVAGMGQIASPDRIRKQVDALLEIKPPIFAAGLGNPSWLVPSCHAQGINVWALIGNTRHAQRVSEGGVDYIVAQGTESAGHTGNIATYALLPQVINVVGDIPVLVAGGVGTGRHLAAALAMGAVGVWTGTIWLATTEANTEPYLVERLIAASERDTTISDAASGHPMRVLNSKWTEMWQQPGAPMTLPAHLQALLVRDFQRSIRENNLTDYMTTPAGQIVGAIHKVQSCAELMEEMNNEAKEMIARLAGTLAAPIPTQPTP